MCAIKVNDLQKYYNKLRDIPFFLWIFLAILGYVSALEEGLVHV